MYTFVVSDLEMKDLGLFYSEFADLVAAVINTGSGTLLIWSPTMGPLKKLGRINGMVVLPGYGQIS